MECELVEVAGGDRSHALSAWTSTHRDLDPERILRIPDLLALLTAGSDGEEHGTPFEKSYIQFLIRVDTVTHYQLLKHRIGVSINTESARYKELKSPTCHVPDYFSEDSKALLRLHFNTSVLYYQTVLKHEEERLGRKRAKEAARFFLPLANELTMDISFSWRSFAHFQRLRNAEGAQREINELAKRMLQLVSDLPDKPFEHTIAAYRAAGRLP